MRLSMISLPVCIGFGVCVHPVGGPESCVNHCMWCLFRWSDGQGLVRFSWKVLVLGSRWGSASLGRLRCGEVDLCLLRCGSLLSSCMLGGGGAYGASVPLMTMPGMMLWEFPWAFISQEEFLQACRSLQ
ncbi:hypothetical protein Ancab_003858 [Ancistrocladus abbreviatus]